MVQKDLLRWTISHWLITAVMALAITLLATCSSTSSRVTYSDSDPAWSPDGNKIAFVSNRDGKFMLYVMNNDGTDQTRLSSEFSTVRKPRWSPDGTKLLFLYSDSWYTDNKKLGVISADGSQPVKLGNILVAQDIDQQWSADSTKIVFYSGTIQVINADGSNLASLVKGSYPKWSPDGSHIAFISSSELYIMGADGSDQIRVDTPGGGKEGLVWSPDSRRLAYQRDGIHIVNSDGSGYQTFNLPDLVQDVMWSPNGNKIIFTTLRLRAKDPSMRMRVQVLDVVSGSVSDLAYGIRPAWSPDGTKIAFTSNEDIYVMNANGTNRVKLTK